MTSNGAFDFTDSLSHNNFAENQVRSHLFAAFAAIAWYNAIELIALCLASFKRRHGWYFWSLLVSSGGIIPNCLGYILLFFDSGVTPYVSITMVVSGWVMMVTGQSVVLWSRLHLVMQNIKILRAVLGMIIIDMIVFQFPTIVLMFGSVAPISSAFTTGYNVIERVQLIAFCIQEFIISSIYVYETIKLLRLRPQGRPNGILRQLLIINVVILVLDIAVVVTEWIGLYSVQALLKPAIYSVKLKLEYAILGKLVAIARAPLSGSDLLSSGWELDDTLRNQSSNASSRKYSLPWFWDVSSPSQSTSTP
ncbi:hypothetical protein N7468_003970 [Penicillium chermesinum]|uniref:DUF7703 domain-containing protein n=1 Tax=Penicillium chermesinum TaxID=63820 RepID=A0A9W9P890_9EURO|nr:uncharacterized protein N7468_003970 [Penicillium chermesinum]KAJ5239351.1 hypothetical protein N7468_003970 [Penicillium chermesinum]KAJ6164973.1 hypothetical protein N7470_003645 [Penicillium chermesinum]